MIYEQTLQDMDMNKTRVTKEEISVSVQEKTIHFRYVKCDKCFIYFGCFFPLLRLISINQSKKMTSVLGKKTVLPLVPCFRRNTFLMCL